MGDHSDNKDVNRRKFVQTAGATVATTVADLLLHGGQNSTWAADTSTSVVPQETTLPKEIESSSFLIGGAITRPDPKADEEPAPTKENSKAFIEFYDRYHLLRDTMRFMHDLTKKDHPVIELVTCGYPDATAMAEKYTTLLKVNRRKITSKDGVRNIARKKSKNILNYAMA